MLAPGKLLFSRDMLIAMVVQTSRTRNIDKKALSYLENLCSNVDHVKIEIIVLPIINSD